MPGDDAQQIGGVQPHSGGIVVGVYAYHPRECQKVAVKEEMHPALSIVQQGEGCDRTGLEVQDIP